MGWLLFALLVTAIIATPLYAADSRDGRDWKPIEESLAPYHALVRPSSGSSAARLMSETAALLFRRRHVETQAQRTCAYQNRPRHD